MASFTAAQFRPLIDAMELIEKATVPTTKSRANEQQRKGDDKVRNWADWGKKTA